MKDEKRDIRTYTNEKQSFIRDSFDRMYLNISKVEKIGNNF
jgi:hypothetical protein